jgi:hypothetical protein
VISLQFDETDRQLGIASLMMGEQPVLVMMGKYLDSGFEVSRLALKRWLATASVASGLLLAAPFGRSQPTDAGLNLPDAPIASPQQNTSPNSSTPAAPADTASQTSSAQSTSGQSTEEAARKKAQDQLKQQEHQRVLGVMATFNTTTNKDALPLTAGQKYQLFFKSATDPWPFALAAFVSGIDQAENSFPEYGQGVQGYAKRFGASYTDYFTGNLLGNAVLTSLLHEDPRFFQKGTGSATSRALWAAGSTVWCKRDKGTWGPNYANVIGNLMGAAVSNLYYPESDRTASGTIERGLTVTVEGIVGAEVIEFWPDVVRHHKQKQAKKLAAQAAQNKSPNNPQPLPSTPAPAPANPQN